MSTLHTIFPRFEPYSKEEEALFDCIIDCHRKAALENECVSSTAVRCSMAGGASLATNFIAGLSTIGVRHAPVGEARHFIFGGGNPWHQLLEEGHRIPGFGNQFFLDQIDPSFVPAYKLLDSSISGFLDRIAAIIRKERKNDTIYPNAAGITAAVAFQLNLPPGGEFLIFLIGRGAGWLTFR